MFVQYLQNNAKHAIQSFEIIEIKIKTCPIQKFKIKKDFSGISLATY